MTLTAQETPTQRSTGVQAGVPLVFACDEAYAPMLATTLRSVVEANANGWQLAIHVLSGEISERTRQKVLRSLPKGSVTIRWLPVDLSAFRDFPVHGHVSLMTYARLVLPQFFPETVSKVLYLDADVLVLDDLRGLWNAPLEGAVLGAVADKSIEQMLQRDGKLPEGVPSVSEYFNAGILLIDLHQWREKRISEVALDYLAHNPQTRFWDQDGLNLACDGLWKKLDFRWNYQTHVYPSFLALPPHQRPAIAHFTSSKKPWKGGVYAEFYDSVRSRTAFRRGMWERFQKKVVLAARKAWRVVKHVVPMFAMLISKTWLESQRKL